VIAWTDSSFFFQFEVQYNWYPDMAFDGGKSEGGTLDKGWGPGLGFLWELLRQQKRTKLDALWAEKAHELSLVLLKSPCFFGIPS